MLSKYFSYLNFTKTCYDKFVMNKAPYKAIDIANYLIKKSREEKNKLNKLTHLKLQKILYYVQGWYLANRSIPLFEDSIEAWALGPAIRNIYNRYNYYGSKILDNAFEENQINIINAGDKRFLDNLWNKYKKFTAPELVGITHTEMPWYKIRNGLADGKKSNLEIPVGLIDTYFKKRLQDVSG
jgi:uncharacterized phage-associated protein